MPPNEPTLARFRQTKVLKADASTAEARGVDTVAEALQGVVNDWLEGRDEEKLVGTPLYQIGPDGTHYVVLFFTEG